MLSMSLMSQWLKGNLQPLTAGTWLTMRVSEIFPIEPGAKANWVLSMLTFVATRQSTLDHERCVY